MKIKLIDYKVVNLSFHTPEHKKEASGNNMELEVGQFFPDDENNIFGVGFKVSLIQEEYSAHVEMRFFFETDSPITTEFKKSPFPSINAPAIAFPYLRSFISIMTMQAGYHPVVIPSINFVEFARKAVKEQDPV